VQYGYVRTQAIRRKAADAGIQMVGEKVKVLNATERELIKVLYQYPSIIDSAALQYDPSIVANFAYDVVRHFNTFYQSCSILREEDVAVRLLRMQLCELTGQCVQSSMGILGIQMPERM
jgi:arginyl-tRNA synthetase